MAGDKDQIKNVDTPIAVGVRGGFTETVGNLHQIQDVDTPIVVDISETFGCEIDFAIKVGEQDGGGGTQISVPYRRPDSRFG